MFVWFSGYMYYYWLSGSDSLFMFSPITLLPSVLVLCYIWSPGIWPLPVFLLFFWLISACHIKSPILFALCIWVHHSLSLTITVHNTRQRIILPDKNPFNQIELFYGIAWLLLEAFFTGVQYALNFQVSTRCPWSGFYFPKKKKKHTNQMFLCGFIRYGLMAAKLRVIESQRLYLLRELYLWERLCLWWWLVQIAHLLHCQVSVTYNKELSEAQSQQFGNRYISCLDLLVFCCCSQSTSRFDVLCVWRCSSPYHCCKLWLFQLLLSSCQLE